MGYRRVIITDFGGPEVLKVIEEPALPEPKHGEVRVKVLAAGADFTDAMIRKGMFPMLKRSHPFHRATI